MCLHVSAGLAHTVVILPRIVPSVRHFSPDRTPTDDFTEWDVPKLAGLVEHFCSLTGATTLPSLPEWTTLPDKVRSLSDWQTRHTASSLQRA